MQGQQGWKHQRRDSHREQTGLSKYFTKLPNCWISFAISTGLNNSSWFSDLLTEWEGPWAGNRIKTFDPRTQVSPDKVQLTFQYFLPGIHFSVIMNVSVALSQFHGLRSPQRCETFLQVFAQDRDCYKEEEMRGILRPQLPSSGVTLGSARCVIIWSLQNISLD